MRKSQSSLSKHPVRFFCCEIQTNLTLCHSRSGFPEEKDVYKLKSKGKPITCFRCKGSAAPIGSGVAAGVAVGRRMLSCDYCSLHWHLDCLDPPPPTMPHPVRKWMCPNHAQSLLVSNNRRCLEGVLLTCATLGKAQEKDFEGRHEGGTSHPSRHEEQWSNRDSRSRR